MMKSASSKYVSNSHSLDNQQDYRFISSIIYETMAEPVVASDEHSYERAEIEKWFQRPDWRAISPRTNLSLENMTLIKNISLKHAIEAYSLLNQSWFRG